MPAAAANRRLGDSAVQLFASETFSPSVAAAEIEESTEPYSLQWFLEIENYRHSRRGKWIPRLLEFAKHSGETLLGLGNGLGTDWIQYARHGAEVVVCSPQVEQLDLIRRNFGLRGLPGQFLHGGYTTLPLANASIDVACVSNLLHEVAEPELVVNEIYRVLKPGGKVLAVTSAKYNVDYWSDLVFPWRRWLLGRRRIPHGFSHRTLIQMFGQFEEHRIHKRHLRRKEVPHPWRWLPLHLLERLMGRVLVLKAFKPLRTALAPDVAA